MTDGDEHPQAGPWPRIDVQCLSCGRAGSFDGDDRRIAGAALVALTRRLRCSECGSRAVKAVAVDTPRNLARRMRELMSGHGG